MTVAPLLLVLLVALLAPPLVEPRRQHRLASRLDERELADRAEAIRTNLHRLRSDSIYRSVCADLVL